MTTSAAASSVSVAKGIRLAPRAPASGCGALALEERLQARDRGDHDRYQELPERRGTGGEHLPQALQHAGLDRRGDRAADDEAGEAVLGDLVARLVVGVGV